MVLSVTRALAVEHQRLLAQLHSIADRFESPHRIEPAFPNAQYREAIRMLGENLTPHLEAEEGIVYPYVDRLLNSPGLTESMKSDNREILLYINRLTGNAGLPLTPASEVMDAGASLPDLWGLMALMRLHFEREERLIFNELDHKLDVVAAAAMLRALNITVPVLDRLGPAEAKLYHHLTEHLASESIAFDGYQEILQQFDSSTHVGYLLDFVMKDEERHHEIFRDLIGSLERGGSADVGFAVPEVSPVPEADALRQKLGNFIRFERADRQELVELANDLRRQATDPLWLLLVEIMQRDTDKHLRILEFIHQTVRAADIKASRRRLRRRRRVRLF